MSILGHTIPAVTWLIFFATIIMIVGESRVNRNYKTIQMMGLLTLYTFWEKTRDLNFTQEVISYLIVSALTGMLFGTVRSLTLKMYYSECRGVVLDKGTPLSVGIFILGFFANLFLKYGFDRLHEQEAAITAVGQAVHVLVSMICVKLSVLYQAKHRKNIPVVEKCG